MIHFLAALAVVFAAISVGGTLMRWNTFQDATIRFNFRDGNGAVPAHRHVYPNGSVGGWVADTA